MNNFTTFFVVLNNLMVLCICMSAGFICRKTRIVNDEVSRGLSGLLLNVTLPCNIIMSLQKPFSKTLITEGAFVFLAISAVIYIGAGLGSICHRLTKSNPEHRGIWTYAAAFPNIVYMGFPVIQAVYGTDALFYVTFGSVSFNIIAFTSGIKWIAKEPVKTGRLPNAVIPSIAVGLVMFMCSLSLPQVVGQALNMIGGMTTPISMIIIGGLLAKSDGDIFKDLKIYVICLLRLGIMPLFTFFALNPWISNKMLLGIILIIAGMPCATNTAIFAEKYGGDAVTASRVVFVSTMLSVLSIPLVSLLL